MTNFRLVTIIFLLATPLAIISAQNCGRQAGNAPCSNGNCCSQYGYCGNTPAHCLPANNCQSQCSGSVTPSPTPPTPTGGNDVGSIITGAVFDQMLKYRNDPRCRGNGFYTYTAFINAAKAYNGFGTTGTAEVRKRELAAFFGQTSHETTGGWPSAPDGPFLLGGIALLENKILRVTTATLTNGLVLKNTLAEDLSNSLTTITTGNLDGRLIGI